MKDQTQLVIAGMVCGTALGLGAMFATAQGQASAVAGATAADEAWDWAYFPGIDGDPGSEITYFDGPVIIHKIYNSDPEISNAVFQSDLVDFSGRFLSDLSGVVSGVLGIGFDGTVVLDRTLNAQVNGLRLRLGNTGSGAPLVFLYRSLGGEPRPFSDITTSNANPGDPDYKRPDGQVDTADLTTFVEEWVNQN